MLSIVTASKGFKGFVITSSLNRLAILRQRFQRDRNRGHTCVHCAQHASNELVNTVTLLHKWHQGRNTALIVRTGLEMREDQLLETVDLVLQGHEIGNSLITIVMSAIKPKEFSKERRMRTLH